jgi:hypothetical protein
MLIREIFFFACLKSLKKGVGSLCQRYRSADPNPHQDVKGPQHCLKQSCRSGIMYLCIKDPAPELEPALAPTLNEATEIKMNRIGQ